jgi:ankyrin repeat protein
MVAGCDKQETDIWDAAAHGNIEAVKQHLDSGADINAAFYQPEQEKQAKLQIAEFLRKNGGKHRNELE